MLMQHSSARFIPVPTLHPAPSEHPRFTRRAISLLCAFAFILTLTPAQAQRIKTIVSFGDSLSDTGNVATLTQAKYGIRIPGPLADYTDGRYTDGTDTVPAAHAYNGVWLEQFSSMLRAKPPVINSLAGGSNYAYGSAEVGNGTTPFTFGTGNALFVNVDNVGQQITSYLATSPKIHGKTLFVVWGGANDLLSTFSQTVVVQAAIQQAFNVQRLIDAGARDILILNLPPLGAIPSLNMTPYSVPFTQATILYNQTLDAALAILRHGNDDDDLSIKRLDIFNLFNQVIANPAAFSLANVTSSSQFNYVVNPDTYLFWDGLHPTTHVHNLIALSALTLLYPDACEAHAPSHQVCERIEQAIH